MRLIYHIVACLLVAGGTATAFPVAINDVFTVQSGQTSFISANFNDLREEVEETLKYVSVSNPSHGTIVWDSFSIEYTPTPGYVGDDSFTYTVKDSQNRVSNVGTVLLHVGNRPIIDYMAVNPAILEKGETFEVQIGVTSTNSPIASVTFNGQPLTFSNGAYRGTFTAAMTTGSFDVPVVATAQDSTSASDVTGYWVYPVYHTLARSLGHPVAQSPVAYAAFFQLSGKVTATAFSQFTLDDGSGLPVTCWLVNHGLAVGDHATVKGSPLVFSPTQIYLSIPAANKSRKDN